MTTSVKTFNPVIILDAIAMKERLMSKIKTINGCWVWQGVKRKELPLGTALESIAFYLTIYVLCCQVLTLI
jgi:hypothetical protein